MFRDDVCEDRREKQGSDDHRGVGCDHVMEGGEGPWRAPGVSAKLFVGLSGGRRGVSLIIIQ